MGVWFEGSSSSLSVRTMSGSNSRGSLPYLMSLSWTFCFWRKRSWFRVSKAARSVERFVGVKLRQSGQHLGSAITIK